jgi:hypothetical protein
MVFDPPMRGSESSVLPNKIETILFKQSHICLRDGLLFSVIRISNLTQPQEDGQVQDLYLFLGRVSRSLEYSWICIYYLSGSVLYPESFWRMEHYTRYLLHPSGEGNFPRSIPQGFTFVHTYHRRYIGIGYWPCTAPAKCLSYTYPSIHRYSIYAWLYPILVGRYGLYLPQWDGRWTDYDIGIFAVRNVGIRLLLGH